MAGPTNQMGPISPDDEETYVVQLQDGSQIHIAGPKGATQQDLQQAVADHMAQAGDKQPGAQVVGDSGSYDDGFDAPPEPTFHLSPPDEAAFKQLALHGTLDQLLQFQAAHGMQSKPGSMAAFVRDRDHAIATGGQVSDQITYGFPDVSHDPAANAGDTVSRGVANVLTLGAGNKIKAGMAAVGLGDEGTDGATMGERYNRTLDRQNGLDQWDHHEHPYVRLASELAGGILLPAGIEGVGLRAGTEALRGGASIQEARAAAAVAVRNRLAAVGGGYGAAHGALSADDPAHALTGALSEGALGAVTGGLIGQGAKLRAPAVQAASAAARAAPAVASPQDAVALFDRVGIDPLLPYVGGPKSQMAAGVTHMTLGGIPMSRAVDETLQQARSARDALATSMGAVRDPYGTGRAAQTGATAWIGRNAGKTSALYDAIPIAGGADATLAGTKGALADVNAGLTSNPELSAIISDPTMKAYQDAINGVTREVPTGILDENGKPITRQVQAGGKLSWQDMKAFRTYVGQKMNGITLQSDIPQQALSHLYAGLSQDMEATARAQGPEALAKFQRANTYARASQQRIEQVIRPILGKSEDQGAQAAFNQIQSWAGNRGETVNIVRLLRSMPDDEASTVRASIFSRLGNANPGGQNATADAFSPTTFATHWAGLDPRAKAALFSPEHRQAVNDLVDAMFRMKDASRFANTSKTALGVNAFGHASVIGGAVATLNPVALLATGLTAAGEYGAGRLLSSPRFARWAVGMTKKPNAPAALAQVRRLSAIARAEPQIANEVLNLQQRLAQSFGSAPTALAANEPANGIREAQGNQGSEQNAQADGQQP